MVVFDLENLCNSLGVKIVGKNRESIYCLSDFTGEVYIGGCGDNFYLGVAFGTDAEVDSAFGLEWGEQIYKDFRKATGSTKSDDEINDSCDLFESSWANELHDNFRREILTALRTGGL